MEAIIISLALGLGTIVAFVSFWAFYLDEPDA